MSKRNKKIIHETEKIRHERSECSNFYGSLFVIMFLIVATAMLLTNSGNNDLVGMATVTVEEGGNFLFDYTTTQGYLTKGYKLVYDDASKEYILTDYSGSNTIVTKNADFTTVANYAMNLGTAGQDTGVTVAIFDRSGTKLEEVTYSLATEEKKYVWPSGEFGEYSSTVEKTEGGYFVDATKSSFNSGTGTLTLSLTQGSTVQERTYKIVTIDGITYANYIEPDGTATDRFVDSSGIVWKKGADNKLVKESVDPSLIGQNNNPIDLFQQALDSQNTQTKEARTTELESTAAEIGGGTTPEDLVREEEATNNWIGSNNGEYTYNVKTGHYTGTIDEQDVDYHDDDIGIKTTITTQKKKEEPTYVYKDTSTIPPTYYYMEGDKRVTYKPDEAVKSSIRGVEREVEKIEDARQAEVERCKNESYDCNLKDNDNKEYTQNARQEAFMNRLYEEQEAKVQGLIAGWLNGWLDEKLGGWSRGVPAGICAYIFGLEYYKQDGWTRVAMNASVDQLQSTLIANSRTVIIEGEKEEITEDMFRYAYTIKLLANQSVEWQTYLYNSCTQETSVDTFYDYGSLTVGGYFAFHYAGAGTQDMIFECEEEICLYDQACVVFADGSAPTCVSLVHGAGFETPVAGNEYDCAITG